MFSKEGDARTERANRIVAGYLAFVAGFANACGFVLLGVFTSHVTGNVGRLADDLIGGRGALAIGYVLAFYLGACVVGVLRSRYRAPVAYAWALAIELVALSAFALHPRAAWLCFAMGLQNGLVSRLSGAVVRTTHLTGVVTDLGVETAQLFFGNASRARFVLLGTIAISFLIGALFGTRLHTPWIPPALIALALAYAISEQRSAREAP